MEKFQPEDVEPSVPLRYNVAERDEGLCTELAQVVPKICPAQRKPLATCRELHLSKSSENPVI